MIDYLSLMGSPFEDGLEDSEAPSFWFEAVVNTCCEGSSRGRDGEVEPACVGEEVREKAWCNR